MARIRAALLPALFCLLPGLAAAGEPHMATVVREEALQQSGCPGGRPLPLVAHWHRRSLPLSAQLDLIRDGVPVLPWLAYGRGMSAEELEAEHGEALRTLREWGLPLVLIHGNQWVADFYKDRKYRALPVEETGLAVGRDGERMNMISPFSPVRPWRDLGRRWTDNPAARRLQALYPDPPLVLFVSNNEPRDLRWTKVEKSGRYVRRFGLGQPADSRRQVVGDGWIARYGALFEGMRAGLREPAWVETSRFVGYNAFGPDHFGRWAGWRNYSLTTEGRISPDWHVWHGAIVEAYDNDWEGKKTAFRVWSMQSELMNLVFMKREAFAAQPDYWFELIFWDGNRPTKRRDKHTLYDRHGLEYTPQRYQGWAQYALWLLTPRVAREWRASTDDHPRWWHQFQVIIDSVRRVHEDPVLRRFWRHGELVHDDRLRHPFQVRIPGQWADEVRWFHLRTDQDPPHPWRDLEAEVPVWTLARVLGEAPHREWLVYAHAALEERGPVAVEIPDLGWVDLPRVAVGGSFYHVREQPGDDAAVRNVAER